MRTAAQQWADQETYQPRTLIWREGSVHVTDGVGTEAKAFATQVNASLYLSLCKGPPGQLGIPIFNP